MAITEAQTKEMLALLRAITESAQSVVDSWESGDLAGAVNALDGDRSDAAEFLAWIDAR